MKKILALALATILSVGVTATAFAGTNDTATRLSELSSYHRELKEEYDAAVKANNVELQNELIQKADQALDEMVEISKGKLITRSNPFGTTYYDYFSKSFWISRDGVMALSIYPINLAWPSSQIETAWQFIVDKHSSDKSWKNEKMMRKQFWCHVNLAGSMKTPWNIEPHKTSISPITCN